MNINLKNICMLLFSLSGMQWQYSQNKNQVKIVVRTRVQNTQDQRVICPLPNGIDTMEYQHIHDSSYFYQRFW